MNEKKTSERQQKEFSEEIGKKESRKLRSRKKKSDTIWAGLGVFGIIGWSVAVPTLAGVAIGLWIDRRWPSRFSAALIMLSLGLIAGCVIAWQWIQRERKSIEKEREDE